MPSNDAQRNLLRNRVIESFWGALWLGIEPFLCFSVRWAQKWGAQVVQMLAGGLAGLFHRQLHV